MRRRAGLLSTFAAAGVVLGACATGPDYERPELELPADWRVTPRDAVELTNTQWLASFGDPVLDALLAEALAENLDIRIAAARVAQFSGALQATRARFLPQLDYGAGASRQRRSEAVTGPGADPYSTQFQAAVGASWQLDLFGRLRREAEASQARVYASEQGRRGVLLSVASSVAAAYFTLRALDAQLGIATRTMGNYQRTLEIFRLRHVHGVVSRLEVAQVESQYQQAAAAAALLEAQVAAQENLLSILLGRSPGPIERGVSLAELAPVEVPAALPASLLERRPDIMQAEQNLVAANADLAAARALYFPDFAITGSFGQLSLAASELLDSASRTWALGASLAGPIFTGGAIAGRVATAEAARDEALLGYRSTVLLALRDVNDSLASAEATAVAYEALARRVESLRDYARLARMRFEAGAAGYVDVLYAENELFGAELDGATARQAQLVSLVSVYRAMGGAWAPD